MALEMVTTAMNFIGGMISSVGWMPLLAMLYQLRSDPDDPEGKIKDVKVPVHVDHLIPS